MVDNRLIMVNNGLIMMDIPSGDVKIAIGYMAIEIVSFPINSMVIFHSYVKLPEGKHTKSIIWKIAI